MRWIESGVARWEVMSLSAGCETNDDEVDGWEVIDEAKGCEMNSEGISRKDSTQAGSLEKCK
jgi:hypothetical protein